MLVKYPLVPPVVRDFIEVLQAALEAKHGRLERPEASCRTKPPFTQPPHPAHPCPDKPGTIFQRFVRSSHRRHGPLSTGFHPDFVTYRYTPDFVPYRRMCMPRQIRTRIPTIHRCRPGYPSMLHRPLAHNPFIFITNASAKQRIPTVLC